MFQLWVHADVLYWSKMLYSHIDSYWRNIRHKNVALVENYMPYLLYINVHQRTIFTNKDKTY